MKKWMAVSALALLAPTASFAAIQPGYYDLAGYQTICVVSNHTWYGVSFPDWGGGWHSGAPGTVLYGNYAAGVGNDTVVLGSDNMGIWEEWRDDGSWENLIRDISLSYIGTDCPAAAASARTVDPAAR